MKITIAIITYMRPQGLDRLIKELKKQQVTNEHKLNILVVDNDGLGQNSNIVDKHVSDSAFEINLVHAPSKGIVHARNRAVEEFLKTDNDTLVFIDDDEWPADTSWLQNLIDVQASTKSDFVTSGVSTVAEDPNQKWLEQMAIRPKSTNRTPYRVNKFYTNNLLIMRKPLEVIRPAFDTRFNITGGSDLHFSMMAAKHNFKCVFAPSAFVNELHPPNRTKLIWFFKRGYRNGETATRALRYVEPGMPSICKCLILTVLRTARGLACITWGLLLLSKAKTARGTMYLAAGVGTFGGLFGRTLNEYV